MNPPTVNSSEPHKPAVDYEQAITSYIDDISFLGEVYINFDEPMFTDFNYSALNSSNLNIFVAPSLDRDKDPSFNKSTVNLTWMVDSFTTN